MILNRYDIYLGCKNKDFYDENNTVEYVSNRIRELLAITEIGFSITGQIGGYLHENGKYVIENSIKITLVSNEDEEKFYPLIDELKKEYDQETVLIISKKINVSYY